MDGGSAGKHAAETVKYGGARTQLGKEIANIWFAMENKVTGSATSRK